MLSQYNFQWTSASLQLVFWVYKSLSENGETRYDFKTYENGEKRYFKAGSKLYRERIRFYVFQSKLFACIISDGWRILKIRSKCKRPRNSHAVCCYDKKIRGINDQFSLINPKSSLSAYIINDWKWLHWTTWVQGRFLLAYWKYYRLLHCWSV